MSKARYDEPFGAVPKRLAHALEAGELDTYEFTVLCWLTLNINHKLPVPAWSGTTRGMAEAMRWPWTVKHLGKVLARLHDRGWIVSDVKPRSPKPYTVRLATAATLTTGATCAVCGEPSGTGWMTTGCGDCYAHHLLTAPAESAEAAADDTLERFAPYHGDSRGDGVGDDERSVGEYQAANPRKTRGATGA